MSGCQKWYLSRITAMLQNSPETYRQLQQAGHADRQIHTHTHTYTHRATTMLFYRYVVVCRFSKTSLLQ